MPRALTDALAIDGIARAARDGRGLSPDVLARACERRGGSRFGRRGGGGRPFTPIVDPLSLLWWDGTTVSGAVSSWADRIAGVTAVQGTAAKQPTASNGGVSSDGGDELAAAGAGAVLGGRTTLTVVAAMLDTNALTSVALELTTSVATQDGGAAIITNDGAVDRVGGACRGTAGVTARMASSQSLATVKIVSIGYDFATAGAGAVNFVRVNGVSQALTSTASASAAGTSANSTLYFFARGGALTLPFTGTLYDVLWRSGISTGAGLDRIERYFGAKRGLSW